MIKRMRIGCHANGFTIVEVVVTIVILAIALLGVAAMVRMGTQQSADVMVETRVVALGQAYLDEAMGRRFDERSAANGLDPCYELDSDPGPNPPRPCTEEVNFGPDGNEDNVACLRENFDDVDDYHGVAEGDGESCPIRDAEGDLRDGYDNFNVAISVRYTGDETEWGSMHATNAKLIIVTVSLRGQQDGWQFSGYKGNY